MIIHVDMDAFYASVEQRDDPALAGKPVIVGGSAEGRGVVAAASYEARRFGVHSAMSAARARRLCPHGVFLPVRMSRYAQVGRQIREIFLRFTPLVEPLSLDEAFLDVTGSRAALGPAELLGRQIKQAIHDEARLVASVGIAPVKFLAKIASDLDKPDGFVVVREDDVASFLETLPIERLWGVGPIAQKTLHTMGVRTVGQLAAVSMETLVARFGSAGEHLGQLARGIDNRSVVPDHRAKQISHETTFAVDVDSADVLRARLLDLTEQVARRVRRAGLVGRTVQLKVRFGDFRTITRSTTLAVPTDVTDEIWSAARTILEDRVPMDKPVRLVGIGVGSLTDTGGEQLGLFDRSEHERQRRIDEVTDQIKDRFGTNALGRAGGLKKDDKPDPDISR